MSLAETIVRLDECRRALELVLVITALLRTAHGGSLVESSVGLREHLGFTLTGPPVKRGSLLCVPVNLIPPLKFI